MLTYSPGRPIFVWLFLLVTGAITYFATRAKRLTWFAAAIYTVFLLRHLGAWLLVVVNHIAWLPPVLITVAVVGKCIHRLLAAGEPISYDRGPRSLPPRDSSRSRCSS
jgi:hypothetical protein